MLLRFAGLGVILLAAGCAGISKEECLYADWRAVGYEDGAAGRPVSAISSKRAACAKKAGVTVDMTAYMAGRDNGLVNYCTPARAFAVGSGGGVYHGVCTGLGETEFVAAYRSGRQLHTLQRAVAGIDHDIRQAHHDLRAVEHQITDTQTALVSPETTHVDRIQLLADLKRLSEDKGNIETAIIALNRDQVRAEEELRDYEDYLTFNDPYLAEALTPTRARY